MLPLLRGLVDELAVKQVIWDRKGDGLTIEIRLAWWAPKCLYRKKLDRVVLDLLQEGGIIDADTIWRSE
jgi:hypothetical protein